MDCLLGVLASASAWSSPSRCLPKRRRSFISIRAST